MGKPKTASAVVRALAKQKKTKAEGYKQGDEEGKVWINFQSSKALKRKFAKLCKSKNIVASEFLRKAVQLLIDNDGDVKKTLNYDSIK